MLQFEFDSQLHGQLFLLCVAGVGVAILLSFAVAWNCRRDSSATSRWRRLTDWSAGIIAISLTSFQLLLWHLAFTSPFRNQVDLAYYWITWIAVVGTFVAVRGIAARFQASVDFGASLAQTAGLAACLHLYSMPMPEPNLPVNSPGKIAVCEEVIGQTDQGNTICLYRRDLTTDEFVQFVKHSRRQLAELNKHAMLKKDPHAETNCHGWVFTGGQYWLRNEDVSVILSDNGYQRITDSPRLRDVVVYRGVDNAIIHTGIVCGFLEGQCALIESKWGIDGVYVHKVDQQPYSQEFEYWRSDRPHHELEFLRTTNPSTLPKKMLVESSNPLASPAGATASVATDANDVLTFLAELAAKVRW